MPSWTGVHRIRGSDGAKDRVRITDGEVSHEELTEQDYRGAKFEPPYDELPWAEDAPATVPSPR